MKSLLLILMLLLSSVNAGCQESYTEQMSGSTNHPGTLITVNKQYPNSPIDGYNLYVPNSCNEDSKKYPVLVFLQGGRGVGGNVDRVLQWGLPYLILNDNSLETELDKLQRDTFIVIMPHIRNGEFFDGEQAMRDIISKVIKRTNADSKRIYLTGLSRGGYGSWGLASKMTDVFAAAAPICGGGRGIVDYTALAQLPLWVTHNTGDEIVSYEASQRIVDRLKREQDVNFYTTSTIAKANYMQWDHIFTSGKSDSHDAWTEMYSNANFYKWLLRHAK